jgi:hypothetical protein
VESEHDVSTFWNASPWNDETETANYSVQFWFVLLRSDSPNNLHQSGLVRPLPDTTSLRNPSRADIKTARKFNDLENGENELDKQWLQGSRLSGLESVGNPASSKSDNVPPTY